MKYRKSQIVYTILTVLFLAVIWGNSMKDAKASSELSQSVLAKIIDIFKLPMTEHTLRKLAHGVEYLIFGFLLCNAVWRCGYYQKKQGSAFLQSLPLAYLMGIIAALTDETIQLFSEGRSSQVTDVWIDAGGVLAGIILTGLVVLVRRRANRL